jgi:hypothetical protein
VAIVLDAAGAAGRATPPELVWAPLVEHDRALRPDLLHVAVYACINTAPAVRREWGVDDALVVRIRSALVAGGTEAGIELVPQAALDDLIAGPDPAPIARRAAALGVGALAVPCFSPATVGAHIAWASGVLAMRPRSGKASS